MAVDASPVIRLSNTQELAGQSLTQLALRRLRHDYLTLASIIVLLIFGVLAIFAPFISQQILGVDYRTTDTNARFLPMGSPGHLLGTDDLGRDHLSRLLYGGQVSLSVAVASAFLSLIIGLSLGLIAGFYQGGN